MKALFIKDILMLFKQKKTLLMMLILGVLYTMMDMGTFGIMFLGMMLMIFATSTISYDEFDNGNAFLFSQPFTRRQYTIEKYLLAMGGGAIGSVLGVVLTMIGGFIRRSGDFTIEELVAVMFAGMLFFCFISSFMLPMMLKEGAEKGRNSAYILFGVIFIGGVLGVKFIPESAKNSLITILESASPAVWIIGVVALVLIIAIVSCHISIRFMERREF